MSAPQMDEAAGRDAPAGRKVSVGRQALRREVNQRIRALHDPYGSKELEVFCECGRIGCAGRVAVAVQTYDELRLVPTHFLVKRGHSADEDRLVDEQEQFVVVEKFGRSGFEAVALERRSRAH
jgi:hypothetical protein